MTLLTYERRKCSINGIFFVYLGDSERSRAPCTNNAQVKFTTRKNTLRHRKNKRRGTLGRERGRGKYRHTVRGWPPKKGDFIHKQQLIKIHGVEAANQLCVCERRKEKKESLLVERKEDDDC